MLYYRCKTIVLFLAISYQVSAQEMWGATNSNFGGTMGLDLNPSMVVCAPFRWELHALSMDVSALNNYLFLKKNSNAIPALINQENLPSDRITYVNKTSDKHANVQLFAKVPSFFISRPDWGLAYHVSTRFALSASGFPYHLANFMKEGFDFRAQQKINYKGGNAKLIALNWNEFGLTGGGVLKKSERDLITGGITINKLEGLNSVYLLVNDINYNVQADTLWQIYLAKVEYGHASGDINNSNSPGFLTSKGQGWGGSIGINYYKNKKEFNPCDSKLYKLYDYRIGFSVIDIGKINFTTNASKFVFNNLSTDWYGIDTIRIKGIEKTDITFNNQFFGTPNGGKKDSSFSIFLPTAASLQIDYALSPAWYLNFSAIQRIAFNEYSVRRANQLSLTLRYERKRFEVAIPYSFYDYFYHRIGLSLRYRFLTIGTDMVGPFTDLSNAYGLNLFFGIKFQHFQSCRNRKSSEHKKVNYQMDCFHEIH